MRLLLLTLLALGAVRADDEEKKEDVGTVVGIDLGTTYSWYGAGRAGGLCSGPAGAAGGAGRSGTGGGMRGICAGRGPA